MSDSFVAKAIPRQRFSFRFRRRQQCGAEDVEPYDRKRKCKTSLFSIPRRKATEIRSFSLSSLRPNDGIGTT